MHTPDIHFVETHLLKHIEGFSRRRVEWLADKILKERKWTKPLVLDSRHHLVMDGQHRMEVAMLLGLKHVPAILYQYSEVEVWSLRPKTHTVSPGEITSRALSGDIYPYKTAKHRFPCGNLPDLAIPLDDLRQATSQP